MRGAALLAALLLLASHCGAIKLHIAPFRSECVVESADAGEHVYAAAPASAVRRRRLLTERRGAARVRSWARWLVVNGTTCSYTARSSTWKSRTRTGRGYLRRATSRARAA